MRAEDRAAFTEREMSPLKTSPLFTATAASELTPLMWLPAMPTYTELICVPDITSASSTARRMESTVLSILTTMPLRSPREGLVPTPMTYASPVSRTSATRSRVLVVPMSSTTMIWSFFATLRLTSLPVRSLCPESEDPLPPDAPTRASLDRSSGRTRGPIPGDTGPPCPRTRPGRTEAAAPSHTPPLHRARRDPPPSAGPQPARASRPARFRSVGARQCPLPAGPPRRNPRPAKPAGTEAHPEGFPPARLLLDQPEKLALRSSARQPAHAPAVPPPAYSGTAVGPWPGESTDLPGGHSLRHRG